MTEQTKPAMTPEALFDAWGGMTINSYPVFPAYPKQTKEGSLYFTDPGVALIGRTVCRLDAIKPFLAGFDDELGFREYLEDPPITDSMGYRQDAANLIKFAGQLCYMSLGPKRSMNEAAKEYLDKIKTSGHGSVLEHASFSFLVWGADRAYTHEKVRHRAGAAYSQQSQRYVDGKTLRFVERVDYQQDEQLHDMFENRIDRAVDEYDTVASRLLDLQTKGDIKSLAGEKKTELRKKVNQSARSGLPNETEAPIVVSFNGRAVRHVIEMRANSAADLAIRAVAVRMFLIMRKVEPLLMDDYSLVELPDGTYAVETPTRKV
jgi:thymidylate synthase (FAD)